VIGAVGCLLLPVAFAVSIFLLGWAIANDPLPSLLFLGAFFALAWPWRGRSRTRHD
jgi:hypothetical protein